MLAFAFLTWLVLSRVSPYIDTAFQVGISNAPSLREFTDRVVADNQAPGAQLLFWVAARAGMSSPDAQRLISLVVSSLGYVGAVAWGSHRVDAADGAGRTFGDRAALTVATATAILTAGVFAISSFARYSSLVGAVWLLVFLLCIRAANGETGLTFTIGLVLGLAGLIAYSVLVPMVCAGFLFVASPRTRHTRPISRFLLGIVLGLTPVVAWFLYAGPGHLNRVLSRVDEPSPTTARSIVGKAYELGAWLFVGPSSLPTVLGLAVLALAAIAYVLLVRLAVVRGKVPAQAMVAFLMVPVPLLFITHTTAGWSMTGPAAIAGFVAGLGASLVPMRRGTVAIVLLIGVTAVSALTPLDVDVLRPTSYASQAEQAVSVAKALAPPSSLLVAGDWTIELLANEQTDAKTIPVGMAPDVFRSQTPPTVVLVFQDPGQSEAAAWENSARARLEQIGYHREVGPVLVGRYDSYGLRESLGLTSQPSQYVVEVWSSGPTPSG